MVAWRESADPSWEHDDSLNLAHQVPAMLGRDSVTRNGVSKPCYRPDYQPDDLQSPQGQIVLPGAESLDASANFGWHEHSHKGQKGREDQDIKGFLDELNAEDMSAWDAYWRLDPGKPVITPLAQIWGWFERLKAEGAYPKDMER